MKLQLIISILEHLSKARLNLFFVKKAHRLRVLRTHLLKIPIFFAIFSLLLGID